MKKSKFKGFTLIELIVVIAIISILTLLIVPNWMHSIHKSRVSEQNGKARVVFNAAQSAAQDFMFKERIQKPAAGKGVGNKGFVLYWNSATQTARGFSVSGGTKTSVDNAVAEEFASSINHIFSDFENTTYGIYINNYIVEDVACGASDSPNYLGSFPEKQTERNNSSQSISGYVYGAANVTP